MRASIAQTALLLLAACGDGEAPPFSGLFHETSYGSSNLLISAENNAFKFGYNQCDIFWVREGTWTRDGDALLIEPAAGEGDVDWNEPATKIRLEKSERGTLIATLETRSGLRRESWEPGGGCPICGSNSQPAYPGATGYRSCPDGAFREGL